jgi:hypothetical protein
MNNNNLYNTNNFIGITHNDYFKISSNALAKEIYLQASNCSNYSSNISNVLDLRSSNFTSNYANIIEYNSSNYTKITSNIIQTNINKLIKEETEHRLLPVPVDLQHTYIYNSNVLGEIRFWCKSTADFPVVIPVDVPDYRVKIDVDGKLKVYYTYNPFISITISNGWVDVATSIVSLTASDINIGISIAGLEAQIQNNFVTVQEQFASLFLNLYEDGVLNDGMRNRLEQDAASIVASSSVTTTTGTLEQLYTYVSSFYRTQRISRLSQAVNLINLRISQNATAAFFLGVGGVALGFIYSIAQAQSHNDLISTVLDAKISSNSILSTEQKRVLYSSNTLSITSNYIDQLEYTSNITAIQGFINTYNKNNQVISNLTTSNFYTDSININSGNINGININSLITSGNIIENGSTLSSRYITSNHLYNMTQTFTSERQYPPKLYTSTQPEDTSTLKEILRYHSSLYLNNTGISYGSGYYDIFSSSTYDVFINSKDNLFNFNTADTTPRARFANSLYNSGTGLYIGNDTLDGIYYGDFVVLKMPQQISLSRYRIYQFTDTTTKAPSLWKVYGSNDGNAFYEISAASQTSRLTSYTNSYYEKTISEISPLYSYIAFVFSALLSVSGQSDLSMAEIQIFGKEVISNTITSQIYTTSNICKNLIIYDTPQVCKHFAFYCQTTTPIYINGGNTQYYKYDIDMTNYTTTGYIQIGSGANDPYRIFRIRAFFGSCYFSKITNGLPDILHYEIYMSSKAAAGGSGTTAGINIFAIGYPNNSSLNVIPPNNLFIISNPSNNFNYITLVSTSPADVRVVIEDLIS